MSAILASKPTGYTDGEYDLALNTRVYAFTPDDHREEN
jgi:hypothetical protein